MSSGPTRPCDSPKKLPVQGAVSRLGFAPFPFASASRTGIALGPEVVEHHAGELRPIGRKWPIPLLNRSGRIRNRFSIYLQVRRPGRRGFGFDVPHVSLERERERRYEVSSSRRTAGWPWFANGTWLTHSKGPPRPTSTVSGAEPTARARTISRTKPIGPSVLGLRTTLSLRTSLSTSPCNGSGVQLRPANLAPREPPSGTPRVPRSAIPP